MLWLFVLSGFKTVFNQPKQCCRSSLQICKSYCIESIVASVKLSLQRRRGVLQFGRGRDSCEAFSLPNLITC